MRIDDDVRDAQRRPVDDIYLSDILLVLLGSRRNGAAQSLVDDRIGSFAKEFDLAGRRADYDRHAFTVAAEFQDVE